MQLKTAQNRKEFGEKTGDSYVRTVVDALKDEKGLLMWDIMNEPNYSDYLLKSPPEEKGEAQRRGKGFCEILLHICQDLLSV